MIWSWLRDSGDWEASSRIQSTRGHAPADTCVGPTCGLILWPLCFSPDLNSHNNSLGHQYLGRMPFSCLAFNFVRHPPYYCISWHPCLAEVRLQQLVLKVLCRRFTQQTHSEFLQLAKKHSMGSVAKIETLLARFQCCEMLWKFRVNLYWTILLTAVPFAINENSVSKRDACSIHLYIAQKRNYVCKYMSASGQNHL